jgi:catechol 2,3-dioxygenase-like lactoylglutathione lyase family enzyme
MKRVTGIGGIFFKAKDAEGMRAWYKTHLGIDVQSWGGAAFSWAGDDGKPVAGSTIWNISPIEGADYAPSTAPFMINYRVDDLDALLDALRAEAATCLKPASHRSTASSAGCWTRRATRSSCGNRRLGNRPKKKPVMHEASPANHK